MGMVFGRSRRVAVGGRCLPEQDARVGQRHAGMLGDRCGHPQRLHVLLPLCPGQTDPSRVLVALPPLGSVLDMERGLYPVVSVSFINIYYYLYARNIEGKYTWSSNLKHLNANLSRLLHHSLSSATQILYTLGIF